MAKFEKITKYADADIAMPVRKTTDSAGYDMVAAEDCIIPSLWQLIPEAIELWNVDEDCFVTMEQMAEFTKVSHFRPTLVPTGMKCQLDPGTYLQLSVRSSGPLKHWLMLANGVGNIDRDYYNSANNEGHIYFQIYNLSPFNIKISKGETVGQAIILPYLTTEDDCASGVRTGGFGSTDETAST